MSAPPPSGKGTTSDSQWAQSSSSRKPRKLELRNQVLVKAEGTKKPTAQAPEALTRVAGAINLRALTKPTSSGQPSQANVKDPNLTAARPFTSQDHLSSTESKAVPSRSAGKAPLAQNPIDPTPTASKVTRKIGALPVPSSDSLSDRPIATAVRKQLDSPKTSRLEVPARHSIKKKTSGEGSEAAESDHRIWLGAPISQPSSEKSWGEVTLSNPYTEPPSVYIRKYRRLARDRKEFGDYSLYHPIKLLVDGRELQGKRMALMMFQGQGGTFGFGNVFKDENQNNVHINGDKNLALTSKSKLKHLLFYGAEFIGTTGCITCVGVYFEIKGNRCFCAHVNAWHLGNKRKAPSKETPRLRYNSEEYDEIWSAILSRLQKHSKEYGWRTRGDHGENDYVPGTLKLVCPYQVYVGHAVISAICAFLRLYELGEKPDAEELNSQGFAFLPGAYASDGKPHGAMEHFREDGPDPQTGESIDWWDRLPDHIEKFELREGEHAKWWLQPWTYQAGTANQDERWSWNEWDGKRIDQSKVTPPSTPVYSQQSSVVDSSSQQSSSQNEGLSMSKTGRTSNTDRRRQA